MTTIEKVVPTLFRVRSGGYVMRDEHGKAREEVRYVQAGHPALRGQEYKVEAVDPAGLADLSDENLLGSLGAVLPVKMSKGTK